MATTYTVREVARLLGVAPSTVYKISYRTCGEWLGRKGNVPLATVCVGNRFRFTDVALRKYLQIGPNDPIVVPPEPNDGATDDDARKP